MTKEKDQKLEDIRVEILMDSYELFSLFGIKRVTMKDVAEKAGISRSTIYKYFTSKRDLVNSLLDLQLQRVSGTIELLKDESRSFDEKLNLIMKFKHQAMQEMGDIFIQELLADGEYMGHLHKMQCKFTTGFVDFLQREKDAGNIKDELDPEFLFVLLQSLEHQLSDDRLYEYYSSIGELTIALMNVVLRGICAKKE